MLDANLMLRAAAAGALDGNETGSWFDLGATQKGPLSVLIMVPSAGGTTPTLDIEIQESTDGSTLDGDQTQVPQITAAGVYRTAKVYKRHIRFVATTGGSSPDFGAVEIGPTIGGDQEKP